MAFHAEERAFLKAIHAQPRDDTPRLVLADWLEEHGEAEYAWFIRFQIRTRVVCRYYLGNSRMVLHSVDLGQARVQTITREENVRCELIGGHVLRNLRPMHQHARRHRPNITFFRGMPRIHCYIALSKLHGLQPTVVLRNPYYRLESVAIHLPDVVSTVGTVVRNPLFHRVDHVVLLSRTDDTTAMLTVLKEMKACGLTDRLDNLATNAGDELVVAPLLGEEWQVRTLASRGVTAWVR